MTGALRGAFVAATAMATATALPACSRRDPGATTACGPGRQADSGECCRTWMAPEAGTCRTRGWTLPAKTEGVGDAGSRLRAVAVDGSGLGLAVWEAAPSRNAVVGVAEELSPGLWTWRDPAAALSGPNAAPAVAAGADGSAVVTWVHAGLHPGVVVSERDAWGSWRDPAPGEVISFTTASDGGSAPEPRGAVEPWAAAAATGEQIVTWCQQTRTGWGIAIARREGAGAAWERPGSAEDVVSPDILFANQPRVAMDARGEVLVAWYQSEGAPLMTYASERRLPRRGGGAFSRPGAHEHLSANGAPVASDPVANPKPALGPHGEAAVVWVQENGAGATPVYLATRDGAGTWTKPRDLGDTFSPATGVASGAQAAFGAEGELHVVWAATQAGESAVYAARRGADGRWTPSGKEALPLSAPGRGAWGPTLAVGPEGGAVAAWIESWGARDTRVTARRTGSDRASWEVSERLSGPETRPVGAPVAAMGPGDRTLVGWAAGSLTDARVAFARVE